MYFKFKRAIDFLIAGVALIVLSPLFLILTIAVKLDSKGPAIFKQARIGKDYSVFVANNICTVDADKKSLKMRAIYS